MYIIKDRTTGKYVDAYCSDTRDWDNDGWYYGLVDNIADATEFVELSQARFHCKQNHDCRRKIDNLDPVIQKIELTVVQEYEDYPED